MDSMPAVCVSTPELDCILKGEIRHTYFSSPSPHHLSVLLYLSQVSSSFYNSNQNILFLPNTIMRAVLCTFVGNHERLQRTLFSEL